MSLQPTIGRIVLFSGEDAKGFPRFYPALVMGPGFDVSRGESVQLTVFTDRGPVVHHSVNEASPGMLFTWHWPPRVP